MFHWCKSSGGAKPLFHEEFEFLMVFGVILVLLWFIPSGSYPLFCVFPHPKTPISHSVPQYHWGRWDGVYHKKGLFPMEMNHKFMYITQKTIRKTYSSCCRVKNLRKNGTSINWKILPMYKIIRTCTYCNSPRPCKCVHNVTWLNILLLSHESCPPFSSLCDPLHPSVR